MIHHLLFSIPLFSLQYHSGKTYNAEHEYHRAEHEYHMAFLCNRDGVKV
jgi:hypothetical protein